MAVNRMAAAECAVRVAAFRGCRRACLIVLETLRPDVSRMVRAVFFLRPQLLLVLPDSGLWFADAWPRLFPSHGTAEWNLLWPFLLQPTFSRVYPMPFRARPARLSVEQAAVVQRSNLQMAPARASLQQ